MQFSTLLTELIEITEISHIDLAKQIDYHNSNISKWVSGSRLPSAKGLDTLIGSLADSFSRSIYENKRFDDLQALSHRPVLLSDHASVRSVIHSLLVDAYEHTKPFSVAPIMEQKESCHTLAITGHDEIIAFTMSLIDELVHSADKDLELLLSFDPFILKMPETITDFDLTVTKNVDIQLRATISSHTFPSKPSDYFDTLFNFLIRTAPLDIQLYDRNQTDGINCLICKDHFACYYVIDESNTSSLMFYSNDPEVIQYTYNQVAPIFDSSKLLLQPVDEPDFEYMLSKGFSSSSTNALFASSSRNGFYLTDAIIHSLAQREAISKEAANEIRRIREESDRIIQDEQIRFIHSEAMIRDFYRHGEIQVANHRIFLTEGERKEYLKNFADQLDQNAGLEVTLLQDRLIPFTRENAQYSILHFLHRTYLKKDIALAKNGSPAYYAILSPEIAERISKVLLDLSQMSDTNYSPEELAEYLVSMAR